MITNYATGCAFSLDHLFMNFPYKKLIFNCKDCEKIIKDKHRDILVKQIFKESVKLIIEDIIERNVTFWLPTGAKKSNIHMKRVRGREFKHLRQGGKWKDVDILESMFTGYQMTFYMLGNRTPRTKSVYLNRLYRDRITEKTNNRFAYGDGKIDTTIKDYYNQIYLKFPSVPKNDIRRIMNFGWKSLYLHNSYGGDTLVKDKDIWCYIGNLRKDPLKHFAYYKKKLGLKLRILYRRKKIQWDGFYYFALSENQYQQYFGNIPKRGRPKKKRIFKDLMLYQILDECKIAESNNPYIFKIPYITTINYKFFCPEIQTDKAELVIKRNPLKFKDILTFYNDYEFI